jgi:hypothetical protein
MKCQIKMGALLEQVAYLTIVGKDGCQEAIPSMLLAHHVPPSGAQQGQHIT